MTDQMTAAQLGHMCKHVLPALRRDGMYIPGEEKVLTGEMTSEELYELGIEMLKDRFPDHHDFFETAMVTP